MDIYIGYFVACSLLLDMAGVFAAASSCSHRHLLRQERVCIDSFNLTDHVVSGIPNMLFGETLTEFCRHVPSVIPCLQESFEPCQDPFFDLRSYNRTLFTVCDNKKLYVHSEAYCNETVIVMTSCFREYKRNVHRLTTINDESRCLVLNRLRDCLHIEENSRCRRAYSEFLTSLYRGRFSSDICDSYKEPDWSNHHVASHYGNESYIARGNRSSGLSAWAANTFMMLILTLSVVWDYFYIQYSLKLAFGKEILEKP